MLTKYRRQLQWNKEQKRQVKKVRRQFIEDISIKKTKKMKEATEQLSLVLEQLQGQGYEKGNRIVNGRT